MRSIVLHAPETPGGTDYGRCAQGAQVIMSLESAHLLYGIERVNLCDECRPANSPATAPLALTRGRVMPQCEATHDPGIWPGAARCIREPGHGVAWSHNPGTGPVELSQATHIDRHQSIWNTED